MSDDLEAALKMEYFDVVGGNEWVVIPRALKEKLIERLDRDRKMKAELANSLKGLAVDIGSVRLELTSTKALDSPRLDFVQSELLKEAAKLEAADSKTEASEK